VRSVAIVTHGKRGGLAARYERHKEGRAAQAAGQKPSLQHDRGLAHADQAALSQAFDVPRPQASGAQTCLPIAREDVSGETQSVTLRFSSSHGGAGYVCLYGLAVLAAG